MTANMIHITKQKGGNTMKWIRTLGYDFLKDESGMGVVEIILIIVVLIAMVFIFKEQITDLVNNIWDSINKGAKKIY